MTTSLLRPLAVALVAAAALTAVPARASVDEGDAAAASSQFGGRKLRRHGGGKRERAAEALGLTADQKTRVDRIRAASREARRAAHQTLAAKRAALRDAMLADPNDRAAIDRATADMNAARAEAQRTSLETQRQIFGLLTPEQREKARTMMQERRSRRSSRGATEPGA